MDGCRGTGLKQERLEVNGPVDCNLEERDNVLFVKRLMYVQNKFETRMTASFLKAKG